MSILEDDDGGMSELDALKLTVEEGGVLLSEATMAISGLAGELLKPCVDTCVGHYGPWGRRLYRLGLERYQEMLAEQKK